MPPDKPFSQACENNKGPILEKLSTVFDQPGTILEIGSGTGQHAVHFAEHLPHLSWQPSDHPRNYLLCLPRLNDANLTNLRPPIALDVMNANWPVSAITGVFSANTAHIMSWQEVEHMFEGVAAALDCDELFCLYGPFSYAGRHTSTSNAQFDRDLRRRNPAMGIRDMTDLKGLAAKNRMTLTMDFEMPANNRMTVWCRK